MKKTLIAGAAAVALAAPAYAELEGTLSLSYQDQYAYRGINGILDTASGGNSEAFVAGLDFSYGINDQISFIGGVTVATLDDAGFDHNRYRGGIRYTSDCCTIDLGYQHHDLSGAGGAGVDTGEIFLNLSTACPGLEGGKINLFVAHDVDVLDGTYVELSLNKGIELTETVSLDLTLGVAYSFDYWQNVPGIATGDDWNHAYLTVGLPIQATDNLTVRPFASYSQGFDALDPVGVVEEDDEFVFGLDVIVTF